MADPITTAELVAPYENEAAPAESGHERGRTAAGG